MEYYEDKIKVLGAQLARKEKKLGTYLMVDE